ncbi:hypothetical protein B9Q03_11315, partial [Candidatus Marsarchaeota G2 archaeon OSP_D]
KSNELVDSILKPNERHMLVLDEFHLYYGYSLATIYFMLMYIRNRIDQFIFSSATTTVLPDFLGEPERISAAPSPYGDTIQHELEFSFQGMSGSTLSTDDIRELSGLVERAYEQSGKRGKADVVVILNSVLTAYWLARELENKYPGLVSEIHGLVPQGERPKPQELRSLVVGTSAVEVGVDFDTGFLIFEANNVGSFIQRLGRGEGIRPAGLSQLFLVFCVNLFEDSSVTGRQFRGFSCLILLGTRFQAFPYIRIS